jgi:glycosyltransferase involved in cell wall biosynthesis
VRVGVDAACWANRRGYGRFAREIVAAMVRQAPDVEFVCFVDEASGEQAPLRADNLTLVSVRQREAPTAAASADGARSPIDMLRFTRAVAAEPLDVFFSPSVYTYFPLPPRLPSVITVHDAIAERFPELTVPSRRARLFWNAKVRFALWQSTLVLTVSEYARRDVAEVHGYPPSRIHVAVEAPSDAYRQVLDTEAIRARAQAVGLPQGARWLMYVGGFNPHKNVDEIVRAHGRLARKQPDSPVHLLLVGSTDGDVFHGSLAEIRRAVADAGTEDLVHWPGFVPDEDLAHLHSGALALLLVSEAEGFGLPAVEAAACGCPVIATVESPLPELLEGGGIFVRPHDAKALDEALEIMACDESRRASLAEGALERANAMSWPRAASAALDAVRAAARA